MGWFNWKKKPGKTTSQNGNEGWVIVPSNGNLKEMVAANCEKAAASGKSPVLLFSSSFDTASKKIREFKDKMSAAYEGIYIIEISAMDWDFEQTKEFGFGGKFPAFSKVDETGGPTGFSITGDAWGEDTFANMEPVIRKFLQG